MKNYQTGDFVFAAMMAAGMLFLSSPVAILTVSLPYGSALSHMGTTPILTFFLVLGLARIGKPGAVLLCTGLYGLVCLAINPVITGFVLTGAISAELVGSLVFRGYRTPAALYAAPVVQQGVMFIAAIPFAYLLTPDLFQILPLWLYAAAEVVIVIGALAGSWVAQRLAAEFRRAGRFLDHSLATVEGDHDA